MFNWFKNMFNCREYPTWADVPPPNDMEKIGQDMNKVVPIPEPQEDAAGRTVYSIGLTDNNRVSVTVGYSSFTINRKGVENLISQLAVFRDQLPSEDSSDA